MKFRPPTHSSTGARFTASAVALIALLLPLAQSQTSLARDKSAPSGTAKPAAPATCLVPFIDVQTADFFYDGVRYLFCMGAIGGYADDTFRPTTGTTRGQVSKILAMSLSWPLLNPPTPSFDDVPPGSPIYEYIETAKARGAISGYADGTFKPNNLVTRSQIAKMVTMAEGWPLLNPPTPSFIDVLPGSPFYPYVETAAAREVVSGYADGTFRPGGPANRGQLAKIVYYGDTSRLTPQEQQTIDLINQRRAGLGLVRLNTDPALSRASRRHSYDIGPLALCQHNGTDGSSPWDRAAQAGYTGFAMGEVVGCNFQTPQAVVDAWWASPAHHDILVDPSARDLGCGWWINSSGYGWQTCMTGTPNP
jgi:uncharacterized protein YkwD